jgi:delta-aminolevulinic acid dehydratase/porphobilinogen synthase
VEEIKELYALGIRAVNIYVKVSENLKDNTGKEAWNKDGLMQEAIRAIKAVCPEMIDARCCLRPIFYIWSRRYYRKRGSKRCYI